MSGVTAADSPRAPAGSPPPPLLSVEGLVKVYPVRTGVLQRVEGEVRAVDGVSFSIRAGETLGLVGESGSGKSTLARCVLRLVEPTAGRVCFEGEDVSSLKGTALRRYRRRAGFVSQDPYASLNHRQTVGEALAEPLRVHGLVEGRAGARRRVRELLDLVRLDAGTSSRFPQELSGGQRQRVTIARAMAAQPELLVLDEPVSSLDVSIGAQILNLLADVQAETSVAYLFISHDLSVVRHVAHRVAVMYLGAVMETGAVDDLFDRPRHPYTQALLSAVPVADPGRERERLRIPLQGEVPSPLDIPAGCRFHPRCRWAQPECTARVPGLDPAGEPGQRVACLFPEAREVL